MAVSGRSERWKCDFKMEMVLIRSCLCAVVIISFLDLGDHSGGGGYLGDAALHDEEVGVVDVQLDRVEKVLNSAAHKSTIRVRLHLVSAPVSCVSLRKTPSSCFQQLPKI